LEWVKLGTSDLVDALTVVSTGIHNTNYIQRGRGQGHVTSLCSRTSGNVWK